MWAEEIVPKISKLKKNFQNRYIGHHCVWLLTNELQEKLLSIFLYESKHVFLRNQKGHLFFYLRDIILLLSKLYRVFSGFLSFFNVLEKGDKMSPSVIFFFILTFYTLMSYTPFQLYFSVSIKNVSMIHTTVNNLSKSKQNTIILLY